LGEVTLIERASYGHTLELLPAIDVAGAKSIRLTAGDSQSATEYGSPLDVAKAFVDSGAQWIHLVDLDAAFSRGSNLETIAEVVQQCPGIKVELSGGIRDASSLEAALALNPKRVVLSTLALADLDFTAKALEHHGHLIAVGLDVRGSRLEARGQAEQGGELADMLAALEDFGCSRYVVTDVTRDGTLGGPNLELLQYVLARTAKPVVASGGISSLGDIRALKALVQQGLEGAILGKALYANNFTLEQAIEIAEEHDI
jgi:1-(5-phosphoribosyl)-5-[(5-phosphoribosylamino)methylideneamino] imidazole-4-carboxamide isomerase/N-(5'phosphoribosyl)anthranilate isomerase